MAALPPQATIYANNSNSNPPSNCSSPTSSASSTTSSSTSSRSSTPPSARLRSTFGRTPPATSASHAADEDEDDEAAAKIDASPQLGYIGPPAAHDNHVTHTYTEQAEVERRVDSLLADYSHHTQQQPQPPATRVVLSPPSVPTLSLRRDTHIQYLLRSFELLPAGYTSLDSSRPWLVYWVVQSLSVLNYNIPTTLALRCVHFLQRCWVKDTGGFAGGPGQDAHIAPTYAAVNALCILCAVEGVGEEAALGWLDRRLMHSFLLRMKQSDGSFSVCADGECDTRGVYTAIAVASLLGLLSSQLTASTVDYLAACQTYEGGMGGEPGNEAHGGYTFCAVAALLVLGGAHHVRLERVRQWAVRRQMRREGGFCGRTNKLVDGCYSWWVGALLPLLSLAPPHSHTANSSGGGGGGGMDAVGLQRYVLLCGQSGVGGLRDKPGKGADLYHTCYCLSGLSVAQWLYEDGRAGSAGGSDSSGGSGGGGIGVVLGGGGRLKRLNPLYGVGIEEAERVLEYCGKLPPPDETWR